MHMSCVCLFLYTCTLHMSCILHDVRTTCTIHREQERCPEREYTCVHNNIIIKFSEAPEYKMIHLNQHFPSFLNVQSFSNMQTISFSHYDRGRCIHDTCLPLYLECRRSLCDKWREINDVQFDDSDHQRNDSKTMIRRTS